VVCCSSGLLWIVRCWTWGLEWEWCSWHIGNSYATSLQLRRKTPGATWQHRHQWRFSINHLTFFGRLPNEQSVPCSTCVLQSYHIYVIVAESCQKCQIYYFCWNLINCSSKMHSVKKYQSTTLPESGWFGKKVWPYHTTTRNAYKLSTGNQLSYAVSAYISGGAGGKGTWGKLGDELSEETSCLDNHDPNYDSEELVRDCCLWVCAVNIFR